MIGGVAVLAVPRLRRGLKPLFTSTVGRPTERAAPPPDRQDVEAPPAVLPGLGIKRAIAKTITFRIIVTTLDFTSNLVVIGELATAAGLSTANLIVGPVFYLVHETAWNYLGPRGAVVDLRGVLPLRPDPEAPPAGEGGFTISQALAKTITFRTIATAVDFTMNYVVVGDVAVAVGLSAFAFVVGPFVYLGHEKAWDYYDPPEQREHDLPEPTKLLPAPA